MKCCDISAGQLRVPIRIERRTRSADGMGGYTEAWAADPNKDLMAKFTQLSGAERWEAMRVHGGTLVNFVIRFRGDDYGAPYYSSADRIVFRNRYYNIIDVEDLEGRQTWLRIYAEEGRPS